MTQYASRLGFILVMLAGLVACQPTSEALPTLVNMNQVMTENAPTATTTSSLPTLPPTFTPTAPPPTATVTATALPPTATPSGFSANGVIYYIYNGDSIIALTADGINNTLVMTFGVGKTISDLQASPDGKLLAFVAPGNGSAREIFVMNRDGSYLQQVSCLGFEDVRQPAWTADNSALTWFAAPQANQTGNIYQATFAGSNTCPTGNGQTVLVRLDSTEFNGMAWNRLGDTLFYVGTSGDLLAFDPVTQASTNAVPSTGFGPNRDPELNPITNEMSFIETRVINGGELTSSAQILYDSSLNAGRRKVPSNFPVGVYDMVWSLGNQRTLGIASDTLYVRDNTNGGVDTVVQELSNPVGVISPDGRLIAYTRVDRRGVAQWYRYDLDAKQGAQLTQNPEGTISDAVWLSGGMNDK